MSGMTPWMLVLAGSLLLLLVCSPVECKGSCKGKKKKTPAAWEWAEEYKNQCGESEERRLIDDVRVLQALRRNALADEEDAKAFMKDRRWGLPKFNLPSLNDVNPFTGMQKECCEERCDHEEVKELYC